MWDEVIYCAPSEHAYWASQSLDSGTTIVDSIADSEFGFTLCGLVFSRTSPSGVRADDMMQIDLAVMYKDGTGKARIVPSAKRATVETACDGLVASLASIISSSVTYAKFVMHDYGGLTTRPGPAVRSVGKSTPGSGSANRLPDQVAATCTLRTPSRRHWGRFYVCGLTPAAVASTFGLLTTSGGGVADTIAGAMQTAANNLVAADATLQFVVASRKYHGVLSIKQVECDNVADIQRRRRANASTYQKVYSS